MLKFCANLSDIAYTTLPTIGEEKSASRAIISRTENTTFISFPGSDNIACWLADLDAETISCLNMGTVHRGFWNTLNAILNPIYDKICLDKNVVFTGHSLGGALAFLAAGYFCNYENMDISAYAFEPPRISIDDTLRQLFIHRNVNAVATRFGEDLVPEIPRILHDWKHPVDLFQFGKPLLPILNIEDHLMKNILPTINEMTDESIT